MLQRTFLQENWFWFAIVCFGSVLFCERREVPLIRLHLLFGPFLAEAPLADPILGVTIVCYFLVELCRLLSAWNIRFLCFFFVLPYIEVKYAQVVVDSDWLRVLTVIFSALLSYCGPLVRLVVNPQLWDLCHRVLWSLIAVMGVSSLAYIGSWPI